MLITRRTAYIGILTALMFFCSLRAFPPAVFAADFQNAALEEITSQETQYVFGVFPFLPATRLEGVFAPLSAEISSALGKPVLYRSARTFEIFTARLAEAHYDLAFLQPFDYTGTARRAGYLPLVKRTEPLYVIFVVKTGSPIIELKDLKGKKTGMAPKVAALSYLAKAVLFEQGIPPGKKVIIEHYKGHHSCLQHVLIGEVDACATGLPALKTFEAAQGIRMRVIYQSEPIAPMLIAIHSRVPLKDRAIIEKTLLQTELETVSPELRRLLRKGPEKPFIEVSDREYDRVEKLRLEAEGK